MTINGLNITPRFEAENLLFQYGGENITKASARDIQLDVSQMLWNLKADRNSLIDRATLDAEIGATRRVLLFIQSKIHE